MKHIVIAGGSGLVGTKLSEILLQSGYKVSILTRNKNKVSKTPNLYYGYWNTDTLELDELCIKKADAIVNLAGEGVANKRWTNKQKDLIVSSRVNSGKTIVRALQSIENNVEVVINASATGWYQPQTIEQYNGNNFQELQRPATDFLGKTCKLWEESIEPIELLQKRLVKLRIGIVFSKNGGAIKEFLKPIKFGIAAILGNQKISWIYIDDLCNLIIEAIENKNYTGAYNAVSPNITTNKELNLALAQKWRGKFFIPISVPKFVIKLMLGEMSEEVLKSALISSKKVMTQGFKFKFDTLEKALDEMIK